MESGNNQRNYREPLPYHSAICDYLKSEEPAVWQWYASNQIRAEQADDLRFDLLKSTYRIARDAEPTTYELADEVAETLGLGDSQATLYQAQNPEGLNASLAYLPGESHIVFHGPIMAKLSRAELRALLAHEFGHHLLYRMRDGELLIAEQVLAAMTHDREADESHFASARLFGLYTEVFCDRVALEVSGSARDVISMLVKVTTGLDVVDANRYLEQAAEIFDKGPINTEGLSHPEVYIRAHVLQQWQQDGDEANGQISHWIEGRPTLEQLDLLAQRRVAERTRQLIDHLLAPRWFGTAAVVAHARLFFDDYVPLPQESIGEQLRLDYSDAEPTLQDYYCYVMLDFATADRDLEEAPLAQAISLAELLGLSERFAEVAVKELRLRKRQFQKIADSRKSILELAETSEAHS